MQQLRWHHLSFIIGTYNDVRATILRAIRAGKGFTLLPCSLNDLVTLDERPTWSQFYRKLNFCTTDGMPLVWFWRHKTGQKVERVYGPDLMQDILPRIQGSEYQHVFFGATEATLTKLVTNVKRSAPHLNITAAIAPPFRPLTARDFATYATTIRRRPQPILWIGLGSPQQIKAALAWKKHLPHAAIFCVGAAFDFLAGTKPQAPRWLRSLGLEWAFRLATEPRRLFGRYWAIGRFLGKQALTTVTGRQSTDRSESSLS